ncbi:MAG: hypothetical protein OXG82_15605 [Gammaproteobacteria bacterium]|nr:hypothetical protein [Gammaproteobacteria bacterium]
MRPLSFTAFPDRPVSVNPASVIRVEVASSSSAKQHPVLVVLGYASEERGERSMCVAEFADRQIASRIRERIAEHLWQDDAPPLSAEEKRLIADNPVTHDDGSVGERRTVPTDESKHPSVVYELQRSRAKR